MRQELAIVTDAPVLTVPLRRRHWLNAVSERGWAQILSKLDRTVASARDRSSGRRVILVGHSSGGVLGRLYLSPEVFLGTRFRGLEKVSHLVTLGSPHENVRGARIRRWVHRTYPGAYFAPDVTYITVAGCAVEGRQGGSLGERVAFRLYRHLCGEGAVCGDGLVPLPSARLEGALNLVLEGAFHAPVGGRLWYGSSGVVGDWWREGVGLGPTPPSSNSQPLSSC